MMIEIDSIWTVVMHSLLFPRHACALIMITSGIIGFPFHYSIRFHFVAPLLIFDFFRCRTNSFARHAEPVCTSRMVALSLSRCHENHFYGFQISFLRRYFFLSQNNNFSEKNCHFCRRHTHTHNTCTICGRKCREITTVASFEYKIRLWICIENHPILIWCSRFVSCSRFLSLLAGEQKKIRSLWTACVCVSLMKRP